MQTALVVVLFLGLISSLVNCNKLKDAEKRFILSFSTDTCVNKLSNCANYGQSVCSDQQYTAWAKENCAKMCNHCSSASSGGAPTPPMPGGGSTGCTDKLDNCDQYQSDSCTNYKQWATENCAKTCNLCGSRSSGGSPSLNTGGSGGNTGGGMTGTSSGCVYDSQVYQQGQTWKDACKYKCECTDGTSGKYQCRSLCLIWDLPSSCHMDPPAPGKCCPKPVCPSSIKLQYPPGYTEE